jgi:hypothetical protein
LYLSLTADGKCTNATGLQLPGVLDELFSYNGPLGAVYLEESVSLNLWAPTAQVYIFLKQFLFFGLTIFIPKLFLLILICQNRQYMLAFIGIHQVGIPWKLSSLRRLMVLGVLKDQKDGKAVIMSMKYLCTILAPCELRNAMQMIHMLEGMLVVSVSQQLLILLRCLHSKVTLDYNLPILIYICV